MTSGPWLEVAPIALGDVSIIPESPGAHGSGPGIALWAVSDKGDVLCRLGVSELNPAVSTLWDPGPAHLPAPWKLWRILTEIGPFGGVRQGSGLPRPLPGMFPGTGGHHSWPERSPSPAGSWS